MDVDLPKFHNLGNCSDLRETGQYIRAWEIGVPTLDSFEWSVVLSYLTSANITDEGNFRQRLINLTDDHSDIPVIKKCISSFNPFLNRYSCFYNKSLKKVVAAFKEKLQKAKCENDEEIESVVLEKSSSILKSNIVLISVTQNEELQIETFPKCEEISNENPRMTIYCQDKGDLRKKFNFGLKKEQGYSLKRAAFNKILKEANVLKKRRKALFLLDKADESFITSILKSNYNSSVPFIYSSSYHARKLVEAGFEMDPTVVDAEGFSSFYHALISGDEGLVYTLHSFAVNACHESEDRNCREPDKFILNNLISLGKTVNKDKSKSNDFEIFDQEDDNKVKRNADQLIRFNDFLTAMCISILEEKEKANDSVYQSNSNSNLLEITVKKDIMLAVLKTYDSFFFYDEDSLHKDCSSVINDFGNYNNYYRNLDYSATLYFFDNIFSLKERIPLSNNEYSELESNFFLYILSNKYFSCDLFKPNFASLKTSQYQKILNDYRKSILRSPEKVKDFRIIPLLERLCLRQNIRNFIGVLSEAKIDHKNLERRLSHEEIPNTLASLPEVKDELEICRLMHYLETAIRQNVQSPKQVLIVERALQVLGEFIINGRKNTDNLCFLLSVCLPEDVFRLLKQTRNILTHLKDYSFSSKFKAEKNTFLFHSIKGDLAKIYDLLKSVFDMQQLRLEEFIFRRGLQEIEKRIESPFTQASTSKYLSEVYPRMKKEYNDLSEIKSKLCYKNPIFRNYNVLTNLSRIIDTTMKDEETWKEVTIEKVEKILWPLNYLLSLIARNCTQLNFRGIPELRKYSEDIHTCDPQDIRPIMEEFWNKYKILISEVSQIVSSEYTTHTRIGENIVKFKRSLKGFSYFSDNEKEEIMCQIPDHVKERTKLKYEMQETLESGRCLTDEQVKKIPLLFLSEKKIKMLQRVCSTNSQKSVDIIKSASDPVKEMNNIFEEGCTTMKKDAFHKLCNRLEFSEEVKNKLSKFILGEKSIPVENHLSNLLNRIKILREILVEECPNTCDLLYKARNVKTQEYAKYKIVQRFVRDPDVQASVEMLLFDCMNLLGKKEDVDSLWIKASSLFSGINLRNVLGHGNPALETVGKLLDPNDLPSVLVEEMLQLIKDENAVKAMNDLCLQVNSDFSEFHRIMNDDENTEYAQLRNQIIQCERWKRYSMLIPINNLTATDV